MIVTSKIIISMGHRLPTYEGICSSPHGHNVTITAALDTGNAFVDFKWLSHLLHEICDDFDHAMVLWEDDPLVGDLNKYGFRLVVLSEEPTTEAIASYIYGQVDKLQHHKVVYVQVDETAKYSAKCSGDDLDVQRIV